MSDTDLSRQLRERLERRDAMLVPGAPNALTARIIEDLGFEAAYVTGAGVTNMFLGLPDLSFISLPQLVEHVAAMREATTLPLIVDADTGFGNAVNAGYSVKMLERAGANCIQIEDQTFPKRCGHFEGKEVVPTAEFLARIQAALDARASDATMILARTDAAACTSFEDALDRAHRAREVGADALFIEGPRAVEEIRRIPGEFDAPVLLNLVYGGDTPILGQAELAEMGFAMVLYANAALQAAVTGMQEVLGHIRQTGSIEGVMGRVATFDERQRLVDKPKYDDLERRYATD
ncbi:MAG: carboxyvinyl-carboxyphosphonate phosphorylmutase [Dehalococcoidia bacterium]|nr:carboxyvinyl-carboxyphosphonate phosphorylmutase [Dehalococcoidia bacterium]